MSVYDKNHYNKTKKERKKERKNNFTDGFGDNVKGSKYIFNVKNIYSPLTQTFNIFIFIL